MSRMSSKVEKNTTPHSSTSDDDIRKLEEDYQKLLEESQNLINERTLPRDQIRDLKKRTTRLDDEIRLVENTAVDCRTFTRHPR